MPRETKAAAERFKLGLVAGDVITWVQFSEARVSGTVLRVTPTGYPVVKRRVDGREQRIDATRCASICVEERTGGNAYQAGKEAFVAGLGRTLPRGFTQAGAMAQWLRGWDEANLAAPVEGGD
jgi:hypothetical protein